jgi:hypothetical protein
MGRMQGLRRNGDINHSSGDIMGIAANLYHRGQFAARKSRGLSEKSHRIDIVVGLLAASAIVAVFIVAYFAFGSAEIVR